ncbi:maleylacetoacetate isomerase [Sinimarinibacterium sp. CAU 1509]|uniref:maleylacetoacetate isomerase n=1 Tax=Sinimarinibacterium sp. CAU 1509 TaxID=2562283 RepID=UPI0010ACDC9A|nr:maleylacetoacetate isomerase [Sinimarinibacterium sp. CAU 1509]TJY64711.1 maleylacetoacetate isomerase [Sinimarinibacterium sp. CAU 1509]
MLKLYSYWRSSCSYRVRIALNLKGLGYELIPIHLAKDGGEQHGAAYRALNPQARVPLLVDGDFVLNQSQAIIEYLEVRYPQPALLSGDARQQARIRAFCQTITADVQPLQNSGVLNYLEHTLQLDADARTRWLQHWITRGLAALEQEVQMLPASPFVFGGVPSWADCVLVPQVYSAQRFGCDASRYPRLAHIAAHCETLPAFQRAHPETQLDAVPA